MSDLSRDELLACGFALCHIAASNALPASGTKKDRQTLVRLADDSWRGFLSVPMSPTQMKDLGLRLIEEARDNG